LAAMSGVLGQVEDESGQEPGEGRTDGPTPQSHGPNPALTLSNLVRCGSTSASASAASAVRSTSKLGSSQFSTSDLDASRSEVSYATESRRSVELAVCVVAIRAPDSRRRAAPARPLAESRTGSVRSRSLRAVTGRIDIEHDLLEVTVDRGVDSAPDGLAARTVEVRAVGRSRDRPHRALSPPGGFGRS